MSLSRRKIRKWLRNPANALKVHQGLLLLYGAALVVLFLLIFRAWTNYVYVQHCVSGSDQYFQAHNCVKLLK